MGMGMDRSTDPPDSVHPEFVFFHRIVDIVRREALDPAGIHGIPGIYVIGSGDLNKLTAVVDSAFQHFFCQFSHLLLADSFRHEQNLLTDTRAASLMPRGVGWMDWRFTDRMSELVSG